MKAIVVITTVGTEEQANLIARELVVRRQAACVNIMPGVKSTYRWQGKICSDTEQLLLIKTCRTEFDHVAATIGELHSYELPEILAFDVAHGEKNFLNWVCGSLDKEALFEEDEEGEPEGAGTD